jgi:hypothetical protein
VAHGGAWPHAGAFEDERGEKKMDAALISHWDRPARGREQEALQVFMDSMSFWDRQADEGRCQPRQVFIGLDGRGMTIVKGDSATLNEITESDEFRELNTRILLHVDGIDWGVWAADTEVDRVVGDYGKAIAGI